MALYTIWSLFIIPTLLTLTLQSLRKTVKWRRGKRAGKLSGVLWLGRGNGPFADARSKLWAFFKGRQLFANGYFKARLKTP